MSTEILQALYQSGVVSIVRGIEKASLLKTVEALRAGGITAVEITLNTPSALEMISQVKEKFGSEMSVGAGTVLDAETARSAILSGADFVLSPTLDIDMIRMCLTYGKVPVPGAFTPTEALAAWQAGAPVVKIFPAGSVGPGYIKDLKGPLPQLKLMPVGGVSLDNAAAFIRSGSFALGVGSDLVNKAEVKAGNFEAITEKAKKFLQQVSSAREKH